MGCSYSFTFSTDWHCGGVGGKLPYTVCEPTTSTDRDNYIYHGR